MIEDLQTQLSISQQAAKSAHAQATHSENVAESRYDTLGLEQAYLAQGQSARGIQLQQDLSLMQKLLSNINTAEPPSLISQGSLVTLNAMQQAETTTKHILILPISGGASLPYLAQIIQVISKHSPLGGALIGNDIDDTLKVNNTKYQILDFC
ncbi:MAG: hypothetical protein HRU06_09725 [Oceanospirillaceae bacterium]|nr:hypothetical protein [Oceanospirillaceae bacterium]